MKKEENKTSLESNFTICGVLNSYLKLFWQRYHKIDVFLIFHIRCFVATTHLSGDPYWSSFHAALWTQSCQNNGIITLTNNCQPFKCVRVVGWNRISVTLKWDREKKSYWINTCIASVVHFEKISTNKEAIYIQRGKYSIGTCRVRLAPKCVQIYRPRVPLRKVGWG